MTGSIAENLICLPSSITVMMKLMKSRLQNMMKSKVMKKTKQLTSTTFKNVK